MSKLLKDTILGLLEAGATTDEIEIKTKAKRDVIGRVKSEWLVTVGKREADRKAKYLDDNHKAFKAAKVKAKSKGVQVDKKRK